MGNDHPETVKKITLISVEMLNLDISKCKSVVLFCQCTGIILYFHY